MGRIIEGYWDCVHCDKKAIKGSIRECPSCGKARGEGTRFYMLDTNYVSESEEKDISRNPDWLCSFCQQLNSDDAATCKSCGATKTESDENYFEMVHREDEKAASARRMAESTEIHDTTKRARKIVGISVLVSLILLLSVLGVVQLVKPKEVTVTGFSWEKSLAIEQYKTVTESNWSIPSTARLLYTQNEIYTYEDVLDHYESIQVAHERISGYHTEVTGYKDLGNGHFEEITRQVADYETYYTTEQSPVYRSEPVYKTKYYYEIDKLVVSRTVDTCGANKNDYIGEYVLAEAKDATRLGEERTGALSEVYYIHTVTKKGKEKKYIVTRGDWDYAEQGKTIKIKESMLGRAKIIKEEGD